MKTKHDIRHPIRDRIKAVSETSKRYYNWFRIFIQTSEYGVVFIVAVVAFLVIAPIITVAIMPHTTTLRFIPTSVRLDPQDDTGWQKVELIQNIDLNNLAQLDEFNSNNSTFINSSLSV